jgi:cytoskeleton protein RodZ
MQEIGVLLKEGRQALGLDIGDIARKTCISSRYLQAMEDGKFKLIPNVFDRGYLKIYATFLKMDSRLVLALFDEMKSSVVNH